MGLKVLVCVACQHQIATTKPIPKRQYKCSNCGCLKQRKICGAIPIFRHGKTKPECGIPIAEARKNAYAGLLWVVRARGYKPYFAVIKFRQLFRMAPDDLRIEPQHPSQELLWWLDKEKQIWKAERKRVEKLSAGAGSGVPADDSGHAVSLATSALMTADDWDVRL